MHPMKFLVSILRSTNKWDTHDVFCPNFSLNLKIKLFNIERIARTCGPPYHGSNCKRLLRSDRTRWRWRKRWNRCRRRKKKAFAKLWYADIEAKAKREEEDAKRQLAANKDTLEFLVKQIAAIEANKQEEKLLLEEERRLMVNHMYRHSSH